jgi:predicted glycosyltransferase
MGELLPTLDLLRTTGAATRVILGLRDILDAPHVVQQRWREEGAYEAIERYYHTVLVYGEQSVFDMAKQYEFSPAITERMHYSGYVCTPDKARYPERARAKYATDPATKLIVVMAGGGADAYPMMRTSLEALPHIQKQQKATMLLNTGPFMPADLRRDLQRRARQVPGATVEMSVSDTLSYVEAADLVIGMCGYNTTMEILRSGNPAILIPRSGPSAEQLTRAQLFADRGWVKMMHPDQADSMVLADMALATLTGQDAPPKLARPTLQGIEAAAGAILGYTRAQNRVPADAYELLAERVAGA